MTASFAVSGDTAVIEMAEAAGLRRLPGGRPAPLTATTYGVGELILAALDRGVRRVVLGVGGSATTDGGTGMARALGVRFLDADVRDLPPGGAALRLLHTIDMARLDPRLGGVEVVVASDVDNPLTGDRGAAAAFSHSRRAATSSTLRHRPAASADHQGTRLAGRRSRDGVQAHRVRTGPLARRQRPHLVALVRAGARFEKGKLVDPTDQEAISKSRETPIHKS